MSRFYLSRSVLKIIDTLKSERLNKAVKDFIEYTPIDFVVIHNGAFRTAKEQNEIFNQGYSKCDGYKFKSNHQSGLAVDLVPWLDNKPVWDKKAAYEISKCFYYFCKGRGLNIRCGADWDGNLQFQDWDPYHFEVVE